MEKQPHNPEDRKPNNPHPERLEPGEVDFTGAARQDDVLHEVIGEAITEIGASGGRVPEWGARAVARALANRRDQPMTGALHHFAAVGRLDKDAVLSELLNLRAYDFDVTAWIIMLRVYIESIPADPATTAPAVDKGTTTPAFPIRSATMEEFDAYLQFAFDEADARRGVIFLDEAKLMARLLARLLPPDSQMRRFADTGKGGPDELRQECEAIKEHKWPAPQIPLWIDRFKEYLTAHPTQPDAN